MHGAGTSNLQSHQSGSHVYSQQVRPGRAGPGQARPSQTDRQAARPDQTTPDHTRPGQTNCIWPGKIVVLLAVMQWLFLSISLSSLSISIASPSCMCVCVLVCCGSCWLWLWIPNCISIRTDQNKQIRCYWLDVGIDIHIDMAMAIPLNQIEFNWFRMLFIEFSRLWLK